MKKLFFCLTTTVMMSLNGSAQDGEPVDLSAKTELIEAERVTLIFAGREVTAVSRTWINSDTPLGEIAGAEITMPETPPTGDRTVRYMTPEEWAAFQDRHGVKPKTD